MKFIKIVWLSFLFFSFIAIYNEHKASAQLIHLDSLFVNHESSTTRIDQMSKEELRSISHFTLEIPGSCKITFKDQMDLSSDEIIEKINKLSEFLNISIKGKISINLQALPIFESPATITMYGLPYQKTPLIYKNGKLATNEDISNVIYIVSQSEGGTLQFDVTSVSNFEIKAPQDNLLMNDEQSNNYQTNSLKRMLLLIALITLQGMTVAGIVKKIEMRRNSHDK
jgi:hypothetical protein